MSPGPFIGFGLAVLGWGLFCFHLSWKMRTVRVTFRRTWAEGPWWGKPGLAVAIPWVEAAHWLRWRKHDRHAEGTVSP